MRDMNTILNRNKEVVNHVATILSAIKNVTEFYRKRFDVDPSGVAVWFGNSKQYNNFFKAVKKKPNIRIGNSSIVLKIYGVKVLFSYVGSEISRGLDLTDYDISIVLGPLLRPPRNIGFLDVIDFGHAVAEAVQSAMRMVRSPKPTKPKLVIVEESMLTPFYQQFYPNWFIELLNKKYIRIPTISCTFTKQS